MGFAQIAACRRKAGLIAALLVFWLVGCHAARGSRPLLAGTGVTRFDELHLQVDRAAQLAWLDDLTRRQRVHELRCARRSLRSKLPSTLACVTHAVALSASRDRLEPAMLTHVLGIVGSGAQANAGAAQPAAGSHRRRRQLAASDARAHMWLASFFVKSSRRVRRIRF